MRTCRSLAAAALAAALLATASHAQVVAPRVTELVVFKDGHAYFTAEATVTPEAGVATLEGLPPVVIGTLWAQADGGVEVRSLRATKHTATEQRPCLSIAELLEANVGKKVSLVEHAQGNQPPTVHSGVLLPLATKDGERRVQPSFAGLRTAKGVSYVVLSNIRSVEIEGADAQTTRAAEKQSTRLVLGLVPGAGELPRSVKVRIGGIVKGVRWVPEYRIDREGDQARLRLQATLVNDVFALSGARVQLVVGVPRIALSNIESPHFIAGERPALSAFFARPGAASRSRYYAEGQQQEDEQQVFSNAMMSQTSYTPRARPEEPAPTLDPAALRDASGSAAADLFYYEKKEVTLGKGERATYALAEAKVPASDVYSWTLRPVPPRGMWRHIGHGQAAQLERALLADRVQHFLRLKNSTGLPLTTGPALLFEKGAFLAQNLVTYTSAGAELDVPVTMATDVSTSKEETETGREHNIQVHADRSDRYTRVTLKGDLCLTNHKKTPVTISVTRYVFGNATTASAEGKVTRTNLVEEGPIFGAGSPYSQFAWPWWWSGVNPVSKIVWEVTLKPGEKKTLAYEWSYLYQ